MFSSTRIPGIKGIITQDPFSISKKQLPNKVHCPVCGEVMLNLPLKPDEISGALASGALTATKLSCTCGCQGVLALRKTPDGLYLYSLSFWIVPKAAGKERTLTGQELRDWLLKPPVSRGGDLI